MCIPLTCTRDSWLHNNQLEAKQEKENRGTDRRIYVLSRLYLAYK
jgi:hypothetical protein